MNYRGILVLLMCCSIESLFPQEVSLETLTTFPSLKNILIKKIARFIYEDEVSGNSLNILPRDLRKNIFSGLEAYEKYKKSAKKIKKCNTPRQIMLQTLKQYIANNNCKKLESIPFDLKEIFPDVIFYSVEDVMESVNDEAHNFKQKYIEQILAYKADTTNYWCILQKNITTEKDFFKSLHWKIVYDGKGSIDRAIIYSSCYMNQNNLLTAEVLLVLGANVNTTATLKEFNNSFMSPYDVARYNKDEEMVNLLVQYGAHGKENSKEMYDKK